ncbi:MAG: hypothetical protein OXC71_10955 [Chloroflexi bacterium]|nr:hypothetical protein [Chloroflexota bacterium]
MSEELLQTAPRPIGRYSFYKLGATTLRQLKTAGIIDAAFSGAIASKKPDNLIVLADGTVRAVIEYKPEPTLRAPTSRMKAIEQELDVARQLCKLLIVTSGQSTIWINALSGEPVLTEAGDELTRVFDAKPIIEGSMSPEDEIELEQLIDTIDHSLTPDNNQISPPEVVDPSSLANAIWQKIWVNTGKEPEEVPV